MKPHDNCLVTFIGCSKRDDCHGTRVQNDTLGQGTEYHVSIPDSCMRTKHVIQWREIHVKN